LSPSSEATRRTAVRYLAVAIALLLLVLILGIFYYLLTRPPELKDRGAKDRNFLFSIYGFQGDLLRRPTGVGLDAKGNIYVADTGKKRIVVFDPEGNYVATYGEFGKKPLELWDPIDVAIAADGRSYVLDKTQKKIVVYDSARRPIHVITFPEAPLSVEVSGDKLFVTTVSGVLIGDLRGNLLTGYIARGKKTGQFDLPGALAVGKDGTLYVADSLNYRVQAIGTNGKPKWAYGKPLPPKTAVMYRGSDRKFGLPASIAQDDNGNLYVVDGLNSEITILDSDGEFIEKMGTQGHGDGEFYYPEGITYGNGRLVVADKFNDRVEVFSVPILGGPQYTAYLPLALLLLLLPLLLFLLRRRVRYVATPAFVGVLASEENAELVADALKKVNVAPNLAERAIGLENVELSWLSRDIPSDRVSDLIEQYRLEQEDAEALAVALGIRGRKVLLTETEDVRQAAIDLDVPTLSYEELMETLQTPETEGEAAE
jgi:sugar lactone lactonase YvrE